MTRTTIAFCIIAVLGCVTLQAGSKPAKAKSVDEAVPIEAPTATLSTVSTSGTVFDFQGDEIGTVLRLLARQANVALVVDENIIGTVTLRLENRSPKEVIDIIVKAKDLEMNELDGVFYIRSKAPQPVVVGAPKNDPPLDQMLADFLNPALAKLCDSQLDYNARPETARKIAKAKKALYDALIAEGFTKDEAFQIVLSNHVPDVTTLSK